MSKQGKLCPCGSGKEYLHCCGQYIECAQLAPTAEALMRSRYTAYVKANEAYLLASWHPSTRPENLSLRESQPDKWLGLKIVKTEQGSEQDTNGIVEFVARYKAKGRAGRVHELSEFIQEDGRWFYMKGTLIE